MTGNSTVSGVASVGVAVLAGAASALVAGPAEFLMIQQQRQNSSLASVARQILHHHPHPHPHPHPHHHPHPYLVPRVRPLNLFNGFTMAASRDGIFTAGYLAVSPLIQGHLQTWFPGMLT